MKLVIDAGSDRWLFELYARHAAHPMGASTAADVFKVLTSIMIHWYNSDADQQTGIIPSDTDFAVYNLIGEVCDAGFVWTGDSISSGAWTGSRMGCEWLCVPHAVRL